MRVEQLYPFPAADLAPVIERYANAGVIVWAQEEPENMGAWEFARPLLTDLLGGKLPLRYLGRPRSSSPAEGSSAAHNYSQTALIEQAFAVEPLNRETAAPTGIIVK